MIRKTLTAFMIVCILLSAAPLAVRAASAAQPLQLTVDGQILSGVTPILRSGTVYVPYRKFFEAMGYTISIDVATKMISAADDDLEIRFKAGGDTLFLNDTAFSLTENIPLINGQTYLPLRFVGQLSGYSVVYDKSHYMVTLTAYGLGQEAAIKELVTQYYNTFSPHFLTADNLKRGYLIEDDFDSSVSEVPVRDFQVKLEDVRFFSATEAKLKVTYIKNTDVLNRKDIYNYVIYRENGQWRIASDDWVYNGMELPSDLDQKAAAMKGSDKYNDVLSDLKTYYDAYNAENFTLTKQYTDPEEIQHWNAATFGPSTWDDMLQGVFANSDVRYRLSGEQVVFLGEKEAVVKAGIHWSDATYDQGAGAEDAYDALITLKYANGHWTYKEDISLDQVFDDQL